MRILGVMTGTSCDGLDAACIEVGPRGWRPLWSGSRPYPRALRQRVLAAQAPGFAQSTRSWLELHLDLGGWYAASLARLLAAHRSRPPLAIANHGQTIAHFPAQGGTLQLGEPARIARATGLTVVTGFREGDLAAGGQGAPLVPAFHRLLADRLAGPREGVAIHNIGGVSNLSYFAPARGGKRPPVLAFDTGPGNFWIDAAAELATGGRLRMDRGGRMAREGRVDERAVREVLRHPYFREAAPKSTGRDQFPLALLRKSTRARGADLVATATAVSVESMALAYESQILGRGLPLDAIHLCGGGARNPSLVEGLRARLPGVGVDRLDDHGLDSQLVEAQAFAYCGYLALNGLPVGGAWTGAKGFGPPAHVIPGANWSQVLTRLRGTRSRP